MDLSLSALKGRNRPAVVWSMMSPVRDVTGDSDNRPNAQPAPRSPR